jgi:hypothetical protein
MESKFSIELRKYKDDDKIWYDIMHIAKVITNNGAWFVMYSGYVDNIIGGMVSCGVWYMRNLDRTIKKMLSHGWVVAEIKTE